MNLTNFMNVTNPSLFFGGNPLSLLPTNGKMDDYGIQGRRVGTVRLGDEAPIAPESEFRGAGEFFERAAQGENQDPEHPGERG